MESVGRYHSEWGVPLTKDTPRPDWELLGEGAFGKVWAVTSAKGFKVVVKELNPRPDRDVIAQAQQEANNYQMFTNNKQIVALYDFIIAQDRSSCYMILERCSEGNLEEYCKKKQSEEANRKNSSVLSEEEIIDLALQLVGGLKDLHNQGFSHFDIKPENIGVCYKDHKITYKLIDFGLVKEIEKGKLYNRLGTIAYMAPEFTTDQSGDLISEKADVFSLGCLLYYIAYDGNLFYDATIKRAFNKVNTNFDHKLFVQALSKKKPDFLFNKEMPRVNHLILKCTELLPEDRYSLEDIQIYLKERTFSVLRSHFVGQRQIRALTRNFNLENFLKQKRSSISSEFVEFLQQILDETLNDDSNHRATDLYLLLRDFNWNVKQPAYLDSSEEEYRGELCTQSQAKDGLGFEYNKTSNEVYIGSFKQGHYQGTGMLVFSKDTSHQIVKLSTAPPTLYFGDFCNGKMRGTQSFVLFSSGVTYWGEIEDGLAHGRGKFIEIDKEKRVEYEGFFKQGEFEDNQNKQRFISKGKLLKEYAGKFKENQMIEGKFTEFKEPNVVFQGKWTSPVDGIGTIKKGAIKYDGEWRMLKKEDPNCREELAGEFEYEGGYERGLRSGFGKLDNTKRGEYYEGQFVGGLFSGDGLFKSQAHEYKGGFLAGVKQGLGTLKYLQSGPISSIKGKFDKDEPSSELTVEYTNGDIYRGEMREFKRHGQGEMEYSDSNILWKKYSGGWESDQMHGDDCELYYRNGKKYFGSFCKGVLEGSGVLSDLNTGTVFKGQFSKDEIVHGNVTDSGFVYTGAFLDYKYQDVKGVLRFPNNDEFIGQFEKGQMNGPGVKTFSNGVTYTGEIKGNVYTGKAVVKTQWYTLEGTFHRGSLHGVGRLTVFLELRQTLNLKSIEGEFEANKLRFDNRCKLTLPDESTYEGEFLKLDPFTLDFENPSQLEPFDIQKLTFCGTYKKGGYQITGLVVDGLLEGKFEETPIDQRCLSLTGLMSKGVKVGKMKITYQDGTVVECEYLLGKIQKGKIFFDRTSRTSNMYTGELMEDKSHIYPHGTGEMIYPIDPEKYSLSYSGQFQKGKLHGRGKVQRYDGIFEGEFSENHQVGEGTYIVQDPWEKAVGKFKRFALNGDNGTKAESTTGNLYKGRFTSHILQEGEVLVGALNRITLEINYDVVFPTYVGKFAYSQEKVVLNKEKTAIVYLEKKLGPFILPNDIPVLKDFFVMHKGIPTGHGKVKYSDETEFYGFIELNKKHGKGQLTLDNGAVIDGDWDKDSLQPKAIYRYPSNSPYSEYHGDLNNYQPKAKKGIILFKTDNMKYIGEVVNGEPHGKGELFQGNSSVRKGVFKSGKIM